MTRALFNPTLDGTPFMVAGTYGFVLTFLTTLITAVSVVNERLAGTFDQLQVTPATSAEIVLGKILPLGAVFAGDVVLMLLVAGLVLGVWPLGNPIFFVLATVSYVLVSLVDGLDPLRDLGDGRGGRPEDGPLQHPADLPRRLHLPGPQHADRLPLASRRCCPATHYIRMRAPSICAARDRSQLLPELALLALFGAVLLLIAFRTVESRA